jgi:hypothetical protein
MPAQKPVNRRTPTAQVKARAAYHQVPTKTTADDPAYYSKTPHAYGDILITPDKKGRTKLGGALQRDIVYWIERHTWGNAKRPEYAKLSLSTLAKLCGTDRRTVARAIADMQQATDANPKGRGIIEARDRKGCGATAPKMYKLTPAKWKDAPYYEPKAMELEDVPDEEDDAEDTPELVEPAAEAEATVEPGKVSRPHPVAVSASKGAPAVTIRVVYRSLDLPFPVAFKAHPGRNGRVQITCRATAPQFFANHSPSNSAVSVESERVNEFSTFITAFVLEIWGKAADDKLIESIISASGNAPVWLYESLVRDRIKARDKRKHTTGLLIDLAADAARGQVARERADAAERTSRSQRDSVEYLPSDHPEIRAMLAELESKEGKL